jgi:glycerate 2-kinase
MHITNYKQLAKTPLRKKALAIIEAGYAAIEIQTAIKKRITVKGGILNVAFPDRSRESVKIDLNDYRRVFLVGIGKGSALASVSLAQILGKRLTKGIAIDVEKPNLKSQISNLELLIGTHPLPSLKNVRATQKIMRMVSDLNEDDLVIVFMCGGGSALAVASEEELQASTTVFKELTKAGANIIELNTVRKHLSDIKGGNFANSMYPAASLALMVSDVIGNDISMIASGPTVCDMTTKEEAVAILKKYGFTTKGLTLRETPKDKKCFRNVNNVLFLSNKDAVDAMADKARTFCFKPRIGSLAFQGEAKSALTSAVGKIKKSEVMIMAGETTVTLNGIPGGKKPGKGGRNLEVALGVLANCGNDPKKLEGIIAISYASDGHDNTDAAGGIADGYTLKVANVGKQNIGDALARHASFDFFKKNGNLIKAKRNSFNVADLMLVIKEGAVGPDRGPFRMASNRYIMELRNLTCS